MARVVLQLCHHFTQDGYCGKAYASRSSCGRLSSSSTGDITRGNLLLNLVANRSICGQFNLLHIDWKTSVRRDHSVWIVWPSLDSLSVQALRSACFLEHQVRILHIRAQSQPNLMPSSLFIYDTTVVWSVATRTILSE